MGKVRSIPKTSFTRGRGDYYEQDHHHRGARQAHLRGTRRGHQGRAGDEEGQVHGGEGIRQGREGDRQGHAGAGGRRRHRGQAHHGRRRHQVQDRGWRHPRAEGREGRRENLHGRCGHDRGQENLEALHQVRAGHRLRG